MGFRLLGQFDLRFIVRYKLASIFVQSFKILRELISFSFFHSLLISLCYACTAESSYFG